MTDRVWEAKLEINLNDIFHNINEIKKIVGPDVNIMPIIKDNGYGTYLNTRIKDLENFGINIVGVAIVDEGIKLRELGYTGDILILNQPMDTEIEAAHKYNLIIGVGSIEFLNALGKHQYEFKIHMEIGTGMGRTGIRPSKTEEYIEVASKYPNIIIDGIYTHFSCSDCDEEYTRKQINSFKTALDVAKTKISTLRYIHCCNSAGILSFKEAHFNLVRPGLILYGFYPDESLKEKINLKPSIKLKSKISFLKTVPEGTSISYGRTFITKRESKIATVPLGYADGIRRTLSNKGKVVINGKIAPIIGTVCMDCFMVDVTDLEDVNVYDDVYLWDNENIFVEDIAKIYGTINYEVISTISQRVRREFV